MNFLFGFCQKLKIKNLQSNVDLLKLKFFNFYNILAKRGMEEQYLINFKCPLDSSLVYTSLLMRWSRSNDRMRDRDCRLICWETKLETIFFFLGGAKLENCNDQYEKYIVKTGILGGPYDSFDTSKW